jgi:uncharacterized phiE125 gp8 family phage protein
MPLASNAIIDFIEAQAMFGYQADEQVKVEALINIASSRIEGHCNRALISRDFSWTLDGTGTSVLVLPEYPVTALARVCIDSDRVFDVEEDLSPDEFLLQKESGTVLLYEGRFGKAEMPGVIYVEATAGYLSSDLKLPVLKGACFEYLDWLKSRWSSSGSVGKKGEFSADGVSVSYEIDMPAHVKALLEEFKR